MPHLKLDQRVYDSFSGKLQQRIVPLVLLQSMTTNDCRLFHRKTVLHSFGTQREYGTARNQVLLNRYDHLVVCTIPIIYTYLSFFYHQPSGISIGQSFHAALHA